MPCTMDDCETVVAPGDYAVVLTKPGYRNEQRQIKLSFHGNYQEEVTFNFVPVLSAQAPRQLFVLPATTHFANNKDTDQNIFNTKTAAVDLNIQNNPVQNLTKLPAGITDLTFAPDGKTAIVYETNRISFYDLTTDTLTPLITPAGAKFFYDQAGRYVAYIKRNEGNFLQTLYLQALDEKNNLQTAIPVTSFIRDLNNYTISISPDHQKIIVVDQGSQNSNLYFVDLQSKNRQSLLQYPAIREVKWLPNSKDFIFQARAENTIDDGLFLYSGDTQKVMTLMLKTKLADVAIVNDDRILAATVQQIPGSNELAKIEGNPVALGDNLNVLDKVQSTAQGVPGSTASGAGIINNPNSPTSDIQQMLSFVDFSLQNNEAVLLKGQPGGTLPNAINLSPDGKTLWILSGDQISGLRLAE
ncbi:MAG: hypothetical protein WC843_02530 [Candidatus Gracilibacteria bacterium]